MKIIEGGVTAAKGFRAIGIAAGIKKEKKDMAMLVSEVPCAAAGTFTSNVVKAAPVKWDQQIITNQPTVQAVVINSGIANACTGKEGYACCEETAKAAADLLKIDPLQVLTASTGVIGKPLPMDLICKGIAAMVPLLSDSAAAGSAATEAIMTTDTVKKEIAVTFTLGGKPVHIGGMSKGSGMIHPNMCTMLSFVTTDVSISKELLQKALSDDVKDTYNMISVDGDTSTNDTCLLLANGLAGNEKITEENEDFALFKEALHTVNVYLAKKMAGDGEGATALLEMKVVGAESKEQAVTISKAVVSSNLVKAALYGHDANWGRILCAMGYSGAQFDPEKVDLYLESAAGKLKIVENGSGTGYSEETATKILSEKEVYVTADLKMGKAAATAWGCDLTHDYVSINADYRS